MNNLESEFEKASAEAHCLIINLFRDLTSRKIDPESIECEERRREVDKKQKEVSELLKKIKESHTRSNKTLLYKAFKRGLFYFILGSGIGFCYT